MKVDRSRMPGVGPPPAFRFPTIHHRPRPTLAVWAVEHHELPVLAIGIVIPRGAASDPDGLDGLTALTADLLDEATVGRTSFEIHDAMARLGAELETEVGPDTTVLSLLTLARHANDALALLAELLESPRLDESDFTRVRDLRRSRVRQFREVPSALAERVFTRTLYEGHVYGHTPLGNEASLGRMTLDDVRAHHAGTVTPLGAHVVVSGDLDVDGAVRIVEQHLGSSGQRPPPFVPGPIPARDRPRLALVRREGAAQSELRVGRVAAPRSTPDYFPLLVANTVLGGQFVSRINLNLREAKGYTYGARSGIDFRIGAGPFAVLTGVQTNATVDALREILRELDDLGGARPVTESELTRAKDALTRGYPRSFETADQTARGMGSIALHDLPLDYFDRFADQVNAVTADEVGRVAREYFASSTMNVIIVGDVDAFVDDVVALGARDRIDVDAGEV
jgi:predicted Zn-dependent peptidase